MAPAIILCPRYLVSYLFPAQISQCMYTEWNTNDNIHQHREYFSCKWEIRPQNKIGFHKHYTEIVMLNASFVSTIILYYKS